MNRRHFARHLTAAAAGVVAGTRVLARPTSPAPADGRPRHVCQGLNACKGQGNCAHGCSGHGCSGKNDCKGKGGCAADLAKHACTGKNTCQALGGCASGDKGCAGKNSCKTKGGCQVPLKIEHAKLRKAEAAKKPANP
jgi:hypothetical protein